MIHSDLSSSAKPNGLDLDGPPDFERLLLATVGERWAPPADASAGGLLLAPGFEGASALELLASCAASELAGVTLRKPPPGAAWALAAEQAARAAGVHLYWLAAEHSWTETHQRLAETLAARNRIADAAEQLDLADLAQTIAALTGGLVTIEDMAARVIAYSSSGDEVDALRRLSILGRSGPEDYLALLRTWGVYDRLAQSEDVVEIDEHPESGVRRRLAVGVFAGQRQLGVIWVQQGAQDFGPHAREALIGAARITAQHLMGTRTSPAATQPQRLAALLSGRPDEGTSATPVGSDTPCAVAVIAITGSGQRLGEQAADPAGLRLALRQVSSVLELHAAAFRRDARVEIIGERIYLLLPGLSSAAEARSALASALRDASRQLGAAGTACVGDAELAVGAIGPLVARAAEAGVSRAGADLALPFSLSAATPARKDAAVTLFDEVRTQLIAAAAAEAVAARGELALPALERLIREQPVTALTLLRYLDSGGQVAVTAARLGVHVTTVRYRLRGASEASGLDLEDADDRLAAQLILRFASRAGQIKA